MSEAFKQDLVAGFSQSPKKLSCKWFYDETGSRLFERITELPEYYLTRSESRLLKIVARDLACEDDPWHTLVELGSGASEKTRALLDRLPMLQRYVPVDISADYLHGVARSLEARYPRLTVEPLVQDFTCLERPASLREGAPLGVFFSGSTIGNYGPRQAVALLRTLRDFAGDDGALLLGMDMTQDAALLVPAYDDAQGITAAFNRNILARARRELGSDVVPEHFTHLAIYNPAQTRVEMYLVSDRDQQVTLGCERFRFAQGERVHTENSYKYGHGAILEMAREAGWIQRRAWFDRSPGCYALLLFQPAPAPGVEHTPKPAG